MKRVTLALALSWALGTMPAAAGSELLMLEEAGCAWCERWDEEIGVAYHKTEEGSDAPLRRHEIHAPLPQDVTLERPARYTPTFVLLEDGSEVGRIEGYPGADFFYGLLGQLLERRPGGGADRSTGAKG